jgi:hypothetical protein
LADTETAEREGAAGVVASVAAVIGPAAGLVAAVLTALSESVTLTPAVSPASVCERAAAPSLSGARAVGERKK